MTLLIALLMHGGSRLRAELTIERRTITIGWVSDTCTRPIPSESLPRTTPKQPYSLSLEIQGSTNDDLWILVCGAGQHQILLR
jgi:hypothetical protein